MSRAPHVGGGIGRCRAANGEEASMLESNGALATSELAAASSTRGDVKEGSRDDV